MLDVVQKNSRSHRGMRFVMGTFWEIEVGGVLPKEAISAAEAAFKEINRLDRLLSRFRADSDVGRINAAPSCVRVPVHREVFDLLQLALQHSERTKGAFDITLGALSVLWKSAEERGYVPTEEEIREARTRVGADNFVLDPEHFTVTRSKDGVILDLGAIGKGYAIDRAVGVLKSRGIQEAMINAGGAIHNVTGENGKPHSTMGIRNPKDPETILATVDLGNEGISTSGAYERFYTIGENNYDHIVHREGGTARQKPLSVSVISKSSTLADIYSTAMYVAGFDEGKKIFSQSSGIIGAIFITNDEGHGVRIESLGNIQITETHTAPGI